METMLAPIPESTLSADVWVSSAEALDLHSMLNGRITHDDLERMASVFLAAGGVIQQVPMGASGLPDGVFNGSIAKSRCPFTSKERSDHEAKRVQKIYEGDRELVAKVAVNLPAYDTKSALCAACHCSSDKMNRILKTYFEDDPKAKQFLPMSREAKEELVRREYPGLIARMSQGAAAKVLHIRHEELKRIVALYGLKPASDMEMNA